MDNKVLEAYIEDVVDALYEKWPEKFRKYVGITKEHIEEMITHEGDKWELITQDVYDLLEHKFTVEEAANKLYCMLDRYFNASASVM